MNSYLVRLFFALVLAVAAAALNYYWVRQNTPKKQHFLVFKSDLAMGETITAKSLGALALPEQPLDPTAKGQPLYKDTFIPYSERMSVLDTKATRNFRKGEILQHSDIGAVDILSEYDVLGPFRLIAVGNSFAKNLDHDDSRSGGSGNSNITVATKYSMNSETGKPEFNLQTRRLLQLIEASKAKSSKKQGEEKQLRIVAVAAYPRESSGQGADLPAYLRSPDRASDAEAKVEPSLGLAEDELAIVVPLLNIASIPDVLLTEKSPQIGFVVPAVVVRSLHRSDDTHEEGTSREEAAEE